MSNRYGKPTMEQKGNLKREFPVFPFSVISADKYMKRLKRWKKLGIKSEESREDVETYNTDLSSLPSVSIFSPVLCESFYNWFCPENGQIVDPFAGGSVRGIVSNFLGFNYWGCDLREEQIIANRANGKEVLKDQKQPVWVCGDSNEKLLEAPKADFIFSCPPYADLEVYSDDPADLSNMTYNGFKDIYFEIIKKTYDVLNDDSFACFVVGEIRDKKTGLYRNFVGDTVTGFLEAGYGYYNEVIYQTTLGSLPLRIRNTFKNRCIGKTHQNILVFVKGCPKKAAKKIDNDLNKFDKLTKGHKLNINDLF